MLVDFMIIGAQKSGTTSLAYQIGQHPQIAFARVKEPAYFNRTPDWWAHLGPYHALFTPQAGQLCGEASTMYTFAPEWHGTAERLHAYNPRLKLIYMMRDPIERILSHYAFRAVRDRVADSVDDAIRTDPTYVNRSRYAAQLRPYVRLFPREQILLLVFEEYIADPIATLEQVSRFLGIPPAPFSSIDLSARGATRGAPVLADRARAWRRTILRAGLRPLLPTALVDLARARLSRVAEVKPQLADSTRQLLLDLLAADVREIELLLGRRAASWQQFPQLDTVRGV